MLTRYLTLVKFAGYGNVRSSGRVQTPTLAIIVERERERMAFVPEDYWVIRGAFDGAAATGPTAGDGPEAFEAPTPRPASRPRPRLRPPWPAWRAP